MNTFPNLEYTRPEWELFEGRFEKSLDAVREASSADEQVKAVREIEGLRREWRTASSLASIRYTLDTSDPFYKGEDDYFNEFNPKYEELEARLTDLLLESPYRSELEAEFGRQFFVLKELEKKSFKPEIVEDMQRQNKLVSEYENLLASAQIEFDGDTYTLSQLGPFLVSSDRDVRKRASKASSGFFSQHAEELDRIYDDLVKIRTGIAKKLGYESYTPVGYARMGRSDYSPEMVQVFREQVQKYIVPIATKILERQRTRIGVDTLYNYDEKFAFADGNPKPHGPGTWMVDQAKTMYRELSPETDEFFSFMCDRELMDLESRKGKRVGGYCDMLVSYGAPFIFSNFNGTLDDVTVLTHEAGHAFQGYSSRELPLMDYLSPTYEACEIHSMSMEFFTWPWMNLFFEEETEKFKYQHLTDALLFIPYGVAVDEFQHYVYGNPDATPEMRKAEWKNIEKKYLPHRKYDNNPYLEAGAAWQRQHHIYSFPFYYIDYCLAQVCALQFWSRMQDDFQGAWKDYLTLCQEGGKQSFVNLVELANLESPFKEGCLESVVKKIEKWVDSVDEASLVVKA